MTRRSGLWVMEIITSRYADMAMDIPARKLVELRDEFSATLAR